jgi:putative membrane protein
MSTDNLVGLTRYIMTLPSTRFSLFSMAFLSFIIGCAASLMEPLAKYSIFHNVVYGGSAGFLIFGLTSIMGGGLTPLIINSFKNSRYMKMKQSMFLALVSMMIVGVIYVIGSLVSSFSVYDYIIDALIFGCAVMFAFRILAIWGTSNISLIKSVAVSATQPALIISMVIVIVFLTSITTNIGNFSILALILRILIASLILMVAIYSLVVVIESPMRRNLGVGGLELLSLTLSHLTEGSSAMENLFEDIGEPIDTLTGVISFKGKNGIKSIFMAPCVHPGPIGNIGGGNMPTILSSKFDTFTMVSHGPSTHDFNPVASKEINKIEKVVKDSLSNMSYFENVSEFFRVENDGAKIGAQYFDNNLLMLATFSPEGFDDIDFGVGLALMNQAKSVCGVENVILVDCHNCFKGEGGRVLPGNKEVFKLMEAVSKIKIPKKRYKIKVGCSSDSMDAVSKEDGIGESGIKVMVVEAYDYEGNSQKSSIFGALEHEVFGASKSEISNAQNVSFASSQRTAYILLDSNNMIKGFREKILEKVLELEIDMAEVMTTDTHYVNTLSGGHNPVGGKIQDEIIESIIKCTAEAIADLEEVSVGFKVPHIKDIKTLGPTHATELVTTISSIVAVSRIFAPLVLILALFFVFIWIFYWAF